MTLKGKKNFNFLQNQSHSIRDYLLEIIVKYRSVYYGCTLNGVIATHKSSSTDPVNNINSHQCTSVLTIYVANCYAIERF